MNILIVEDDVNSRLVLQKALESAGYLVTPAVHGAEALEKARQAPPDLIISDILMPVMDGFKLCYAVKHDEQLRRIPFVFYTATYVDLEDEKLAMKLGASRYIIKPIEPLEFLKIISEIEIGIQGGALKVPDAPLGEKVELGEQYDASLSKKLAKKVRELELYKNFYQNSAEPLCVLSPEGSFVQANEAHRQLFGCHEGEVQGHPAREILGDACFDALMSHVRRGEHYRGEVEVKALTGARLFIDVCATPILNERGATAAVIVQCRDMTGRRRRTAKMEQFQRLIDQSNDAVFVIDPETSRFEYVNQKACERLGYSREQLLTMGVVDINPSFADPQAWSAQVKQMQQTPAFLREAVHRTRSGENVPVEVSARYIIDSQGACITAVARDITERKQAEAQERLARERWERTFEGISDIVTIQDLDHRIVQCNLATCEAFKQSKEEITGQYCYQLFTGANAPCLGCTLPKALEEFTPFSEEFYHEALDKTFMVTLSPILDDDGQMTGLAHFAKDITTQKSLEAQLRQTQKAEALGTLAGGIAHDFNNILSAILGYAQLAQLKLPVQSEIAGDLEQIVTGSERATALVKQILTFSRRTEQGLEPLEMQGIVAEALTLLRASIPTTVEIDSRIDEDCPPVLADATAMHQVIMNLCTNASRAMVEGREQRIEVALRPTRVNADKAAHQIGLREGAYVLLTISDTGCGMDPVTREKIFDPYFTTRKHGEGTGLGLSVVLGIVKNHGGHINVYSEAGIGTRFNVYLPVAEADRVSEGISPDVMDVPTGTESVLVVDDEVAIVRILEALLTELGYRVRVAGGSQEALDLFGQQQEEFDLVITDYAMPKMNGIELARRFLEKRPDLPVVLCTGFSDSDKESSAREAGIRACLMKPVLREDLARVVRQSLDGASLLSEAD